MRSHRFPAWLGGLAVLALLVSACERQHYYTRCESNAECPRDWTCARLGFYGQGCSPRCVRSEQCVEVLRDPNAYCTVLGTCVSSCASDDDCPTGAECTSRVCELPRMRSE